MSGDHHANYIQCLVDELKRNKYTLWGSPDVQSEEQLQQFITLDENSVEGHPEAEYYLPEEEISLNIAPLPISHFVDGSPKTVNVGFVLGANGLSYPIALSHVGAASVSYQDGRWRQTGFIDKRLILIAYETLGLNISKISSSLGGWQIEDPTDRLTRANPTDVVEMRHAAIRRARWRMRNCEKELVVELSRKCPGGWIAIDGTLFEVEGHSDLAEVNVVGISKSFTLNPIVKQGSQQQRMPEGYLSKVVRDLKVGCRSPVFILTPEINRPEKRTFMWFIRLHEPRYTPLSGVVKVELPPSKRFSDDEGQLCSSVDGISRAILDMRLPYLYDNRRGESFLYPIFVAETLVKSKLSSIEKLKGVWLSSLYSGGE